MSKESCSFLLSYRCTVYRIGHLVAASNKYKYISPGLTSLQYPYRALWLVNWVYLYLLTRPVLMFNCNKHVGDFPLRVICPKLVRELFWFWLLEIIISHFLGNIKYLAFLLLKKTCCIVFKYSDGKLKFSPQFLNNTCIQMYFIITFHICVYSGFF